MSKFLLNICLFFFSLGIRCILISKEEEFVQSSGKKSNCQGCEFDLHKYRRESLTKYAKFYPGIEKEKRLKKNTNNCIFLRFDLQLLIFANFL